MWWGALGLGRQALAVPPVFPRRGGAGAMAWVGLCGALAGVALATIPPACLPSAGWGALAGVICDTVWCYEIL